MPVPCRLLLAALVVLALRAQVPPRIPHVTRSPQLEDFAGAGQPREAELRVTDFVQFRPNDGKPASSNTTAYMSYDDRNLYVVAVCKDDPKLVRARMSKREDIGGDDLIVVFLDTFHDRRRAYEFVVNPLGVQLDLILTEGQGEDSSFDTLWKSGGRITDDGYVVWMAIPFKSLRFKNAAAQTWGVGVCRVTIRASELFCWPGITQKIDGFVQQLATVEGMESISPGRNLQLIPYGAFAGSRFLAANTPGFVRANEARAGLDAKLVLHDSLSLDVALNPDFSQVESDEPQVTVNQRFEVFFPERRPFFIENASFFQTPENLFFSRRIVNPEYGARLTGKIGHWALGFLGIDDRNPGRRAVESDAGFGHRTGAVVGRVQREFLKQSSAGAMVTSREFAGNTNRVYSLDTRIKLSSNWTVTAQAMRSDTRAADGARRSGPAYYGEVLHSGSHLSFFNQYRDRSPDFHTDLGYLPRVDIRQNEQFINYRWKPTGRSILSFGPTLSTTLNWDREGRNQDWAVAPGFGFEIKGVTFVNVSRREAFELYNAAGFRKARTELFLYSERWKRVGMQASFAHGDGINYNPAAGLAPFLARAADGNVKLTIRPSPRLKLEETYIWSRLRTERETIFNNHIARSKLNYQFSREFSLRFILDYNAVLSNPLLVDQQRAKRFTRDVLLTYLLHPGTAVYAGYSDGRENYALHGGALTRIRPPSLVTSRQVFVKLSYLLRL
ncbi:MAG: hypothetical protein EXQ52_11365 [Bryobacterales bacterium]|nr:hypothetical protein [Bryobacterales bacterium]